MVFTRRGTSSIAFPPTGVIYSRSPVKYNKHVKPFEFDSNFYLSNESKEYEPSFAPVVERKDPLDFTGTKPNYGAEVDSIMKRNRYRRHRAFARAVRRVKAIKYIRKRRAIARIKKAVLNRVYRRLNRK